MNVVSEAELARRVIGLIDATNLSDDCTDADVVELCERATGPGAPAAGVCIYPRFVRLARQRLDALAADGETTVKVVTVVNFPGGDEVVDDVVAATRQAIEDGADEIDVVLPYNSFLAGETETATAMLGALCQATSAKTLKVIIESGAMSERAQIDAAARFVVEHGADFVKTSTGKIDVSATPEAVETILGVLSTTDRPVGVKVAGGVRDLTDAAAYLELADRVMSAGWASAATFRFGSSSLLDTARAAAGEE
ncbi:deoxyribose-phosphate aldolase [soil metagenome]